MKPIILGIIVSLILSISVSADTKITQINTVEAMMMMGREMPAKSDTSVIWFGDKGVRFESAEASSIIRNDLGLLYILMPDQKQYAELSLSAMTSIESMVEEVGGKDAAKELGSLDSMFEGVSFDEIYKEVGDSAQARELMKMAEGMKGMLGDGDGGPMMTAQVTVTDERKKIRDFDCRKFLVDMQMMMGMTMKQEIWASEDVDVDYQNLMAAMSGMMASMSGFTESMQEMSKIKGMPILTLGTLTMMGTEMKMRGEVISIDEAPAPEGTYDIPAGYKKVDVSNITPH